MDGLQYIFEYAFIAHGAAGYGVRIFELTKDDGGRAYQAHFVKGYPNKDNTYVCESDSVSFLMRMALDRFAAWCTEADDYDTALFMSIMSDKLLRHLEHEYNIEQF